MRLYELLEELDKSSRKKARRTNATGSKSPLTSPGDASWKAGKDDIYNWFRLPFMTNGSKGNYMLPVKKGKS